MSKRVSIILPCRNEGSFIQQAVHDALGQERRGFELEILVAVGPSTDDTAAHVRALCADHPEVHYIDNPAGVVPDGLNAAIREAQGEYIVRMDAHSRYPVNYVATLTEALDRTKADNVGGVWNTLPANDSNKAWAIATALSSGLGVGNAQFRLGATEEREVDTVPYGCFRRELFDRIGYFDEELVRNQDDEHNGRIIRSGGKIILIPSVVIDYFPRDTIRKLWRMYREYGLFKPLVNIKLGAPATLRQFAPPLLVLGLLAGPVLFFLHWCLFFAWVAFFLLYVIIVKSVALLISIKHGKLLAFPWLVIAFFTVHIAYGIGYWQGVFRFMLFRKKVDPSTVSTNR